jgi:aldose sugar dehydrogenase
MPETHLPAKRFKIILGLALLLCIVFSAYTFVTGTAQDTAHIAKPQNLKTVTIAEGLSYPWSLAFLPQNRGFLVTERDGKLWHITRDGNIRKEIKGLPAIYVDGQGGLFDIALAPDFEKSGIVFFSYAGGNKEANNTELARARLDLAEQKLEDVTVIFQAQPKTSGSNHYGGRILPGKDGTVFLTLGEKFDFRDHAQKTSDHLGTLIRINADGSIPSDNPFVQDTAAKPEIFSYGHRNAQGIALQPETDIVWMHEHGPRGGDEVNILAAGANYGWPVVTFGREYWGPKISDHTSAAGMTDSVVHWVPSIAPSGMTFYNGDKFPQWQGDIFVGALAGQHLRHLTVKDQKIIAEEMLLTDMEARIRDVRSSPDGYIYILTDSPDGKLIRLEPR